MILIVLTVAISAATGFLPTLAAVFVPRPSQGAVQASVLVFSLAVIAAMASQ